MEDEGEKEGGQHGGPRAAKECTQQLPFFFSHKKLIKLAQSCRLQRLTFTIYLESSINNVA
jgi:hypothetical protein